MKLKRLVLENIAGVADRTLSFCAGRSDEPSPVTLITGGPQSGKSSLLRAVAAAKEAVGAYGAAPHPIKLLRGASTGRLEATWLLSEREQRISGEAAEVTVSWELSAGALPEVSAGLQRVFTRFSLKEEWPKVELVPAARDLDVTRETPLLPRLPDEQEGRARLRSTPNKYGFILRALHDAVFQDVGRTAAALEERGILMRHEAPDSLAGYKAAIAAMCPSIRLVAVEPRDRVRPLVWFQARTGGRVELEELSDSERQGVLLGCAFTRLGLNRSVVLIDSPEAHVHPADQARFFRALCGLGEDNQIIAATSAPPVLASVFERQIIDLSQPPAA